ncbi:GGDEF domain-containing protein [Pedomonas mirosovicensis]|uniref:GGDEF domain-containing protein n=1 Tax=Pedomonas mirosovicensis TaxID=2908641 RepID=UPI002169B012|nr:GGDEF domain-containing protein [Pedomonas mirosovicensis]MCH8685660.1 GGDEF domain-containing protein [Pedomonas mirosovicensis]
MKIVNLGQGGPSGSRPTARPTAAGAAAAVSASVPVAPDRITQVITAIPPHEITEKVRETISALIHEVDSLRRQLEQKDARIQELEKLADTDPLLPVANRRAFVRELDRAMSYTERYSVPASLLFFDMDRLKQINDTYGHAAGDKALLHMAELLKRNVRVSDVVGRLGGDELAIILTHADEAQARIKADGLARTLRETPLVLDDETIMLSASVGVYTFRPGQTPEEMLQRADEAMYQQKTVTRAGEVV